MAACGVQVDGHDVREYNVAALRKQFGVVNQEPCLFAARHVIMWMDVFSWCSGWPAIVRTWDMFWTGHNA